MCSSENTGDHIKSANEREGASRHASIRQCDHIGGEDKPLIRHRQIAVHICQAFAPL